MSKKYKPRKLPFAYDTSSLFLPWIMMLMVFLATLSLAGALSVQNMTAKWSLSMTGSLTVQVLPPKEFAGADMTERAKNATMVEVNKAVDFLKDVRSVKQVKIVPLPDLQELLKPWLGEAILDEGFPLPRLIDVTIDDGDDVDLNKLKDELVKVAPNASLDVHRIWLAKLMKLATSLNLTALGILGLVLLTTSFAVIYATVTSLEVHRPAIELLHLIGARDGYIASLFAQRTMIFSFGGAIVGAVISVPIVIVTVLLAKSLEVGMVADGRLDGWDWFYVLIVPFASALVSGITAYVTVAFKLRRTL